MVRAALWIGVLILLASATAQAWIACFSGPYHAYWDKNCFNYVEGYRPQGVWGYGACGVACGALYLYKWNEEKKRCEAEYFYTSLEKCKEGYPCEVWDSYRPAWQCVAILYDGQYDPDENACVKCDKTYRVQRRGYTPTSPAECKEVKDVSCEEACGASPRCDEKKPGQQLGDLCKEGGLFLGTYCSDYCGWMYKEYKVCRSHDCGSATKCNGEVWHCVYTKEKDWHWSKKKPDNFCCKDEDCSAKDGRKGVCVNYNCEWPPCKSNEDCIQGYCCDGDGKCKELSADSKQLCITKDQQRDWQTCEQAGLQAGGSLVVNGKTYYCCCDGQLKWSTVKCSYPKEVPFCNLGDKTYFADLQLADCTYADRDDKVCRKVGSLGADGCTADGQCDGKEAGSAWLSNGKCHVCTADCKYISVDCPKFKLEKLDGKMKCRGDRDCVAKEPYCVYRVTKVIYPGFCYVCDETGGMVGDYCPKPGTVEYGTCYYGEGGCVGTKCKLSKCKLQANQICDARDGCKECKREGEACSVAAQCCPYYAEDKTCYYSASCKGRCEFNTCSLADYCQANVRYYQGKCSAQGCQFTKEDCDAKDCSTGLSCEGIATSLLKLVGDDYGCDAGQCKSVGSKQCKAYECDAKQADTSVNCAGTTYYCCEQNGKYAWQSKPCVKECVYKLELMPASDTHAGKAKEWEVEAKDSSNKYCPEQISYKVSVELQGECSQASSVTPTSFTLNRGSSTKLAVKLETTGRSCTLKLVVRAPDDKVVASAEFKVELILSAIVSLEKGWNLISYPFKDPFFKPEEVCASIKKYVWVYDAEKKKFERILLLETKRAIGKGVWVKTTEPCELKVYGSIKLEAEDLKLVGPKEKPDAPNLIAIPYDGMRVVEERGDCELTRFYYWNASDRAWYKYNFTSQEFLKYNREAKKFELIKIEPNPYLPMGLGVWLFTRNSCQLGSIPPPVSE